MNYCAPTANNNSAISSAANRAVLIGAQDPHRSIPARPSNAIPLEPFFDKWVDPESRRLFALRARPGTHTAVHASSDTCLFLTLDRTHARCLAMPKTTKARETHTSIILCHIPRVGMRKIIKVMRHEIFAKEQSRMHTYGM
jgi:hypothetical protein